MIEFPVIINASYDCRIDVGGKILTNLLKEWISYRQLDVMEETYVMNECKEDVCLVADDFYKHMEIARFWKILQLILFAVDRKVSSWDWKMSLKRMNF